MPGVHVAQAARRRVVLGNEGGGKAASVLAVVAGVVVHAARQLGQRARGGGEGFQARLVGGHQHGRGNALAGNVGNGDQICSARRRRGWARKNVVVISCHRIGGTSGKRDLQARHRRRRLAAAARPESPWRSAGRASSQRGRRSPASAPPTAECRPKKRHCPRNPLSGDDLCWGRRNQRNQQQHAARRRELIEDGPQKLFDHPEEVPDPSASRAAGVSISCE